MCYDIIQQKNIWHLNFGKKVLVFKKNYNIMGNFSLPAFNNKYIFKDKNSPYTTKSLNLR